MNNNKKENLLKLEYVWIDGAKPWGLRSKIKVARVSDETLNEMLTENSPADLPMWGFDGSSTNQAVGDDSDCILKPVYVTTNPLDDDNGARSFIVLCEVLNSDNSPHETNARDHLVSLAAQTANSKPAFGLEQEYTIIDQGRPLGFPKDGYPAPQGIYYCSAGGDRAFGRKVSDDHLDACLKAGLDISGTNAEVMPGQWEYQIGGPDIDAIAVSDQLWVSRWLLLKIAERQNLTVTFDPKPMLGDWNGAGCHANFSTEQMRTAPDGINHIKSACDKMAMNVEKHLECYGDGIELRLTGDHETCSYKEFKWGVADRTASIRIPRSVAIDGYGYLEDRRPNANCDPYKVCSVLLETICEV
jgi:glutamine synthetase